MRPSPSPGILGSAKTMHWLRKPGQVWKSLRGDAETRLRTRYYIFDLIAWAAGDSNEKKKEEEEGMKKPKRFRAAWVLLAAMLVAGPLAAEEASKNPPPSDSLQAQVQQQQQRILELERLLKQQGLLLEKLQQQLAAQLAAAPAPAPAPSSASAPAPPLQRATHTPEGGRQTG